MQVYLQFTCTIVASKFNSSKTSYEKHRVETMHFQDLTVIKVWRETMVTERFGE